MSKDASAGTLKPPLSPKNALSPPDHSVFFLPGICVCSLTADPNPLPLIKPKGPDILFIHMQAQLLSAFLYKIQKLFPDPAGLCLSADKNPLDIPAMQPDKSLYVTCGLILINIHLSLQKHFFH